MNKRFLAALVVALALTASAAVAQSNAEPSLHVALGPCQVFSGFVPANTTTSIDVRGLCNVGESANAVELAVIVATSTAGSLKLWEYDSPIPTASSVVYHAGSESSFANVRLCVTVGECPDHMSIRATSAITLTLVAQGFFQPPTP